MKGKTGRTPFYPSAFILSCGTIGTSAGLRRRKFIMKKRPWVVGSIFVWTLAGAVAIAAWSGEAPPLVDLTDHDHASHAGKPHVDDTNSAPTAVTSTEKANRALPTEIVWEETFEGAMQRARAEGKPILIDFYADWCGPCKEMDARVYPDGNVIAQSQNWVTVKVNGEKRPDVMQAYGVSGYPTLLFAESNGKPVASTTGYMDAPQLVQTMQEALLKWKSAKENA